MQVPSLLQSLTVRDQIASMRDQMMEAQLQLTTGKKSDTHSGLGVGAPLVLDLRADIRTQEAYIRSIDQANLRLSTTQLGLERVSEISSEIRTFAITSGYEVIGNDQTQLQFTAAERLEEMVAVLNTEIGGRYIFGGAASQDLPVEAYSRIIEGDIGVAGFRQVVSERAQADLGVGNMGRLTVPVPAASTVTVTEDVAPPFGLKLDSVATDLAGVTAAIAGPPPELTVNFTATLPAAGQTLDVSFTLPDGSTETITLTAIAAGTPQEGEFVIGADENATAANFRDALVTEIQTLSQTALRIASAHQAATEFFEYDLANPPQRVDGPPFDTATALVDATAADTVFWYRGDTETTPVRESMIVKIDDGRTIGYAARADEAPIRESVKTLAVLVALDFPEADPLSQNAYGFATQRTSRNLAFEGTESLADIRTQLGLKEWTLGTTRERHERTINLSQQLLARTENADANEVGARLLQLQNQLSASYEATAIVSRLSLVNFL